MSEPSGSGVWTEAPRVGDAAPDFFADRPPERLLVRELAARVGKLILVSYDTYRFHPN